MSNQNLLETIYGGNKSSFPITFMVKHYGAAHIEDDDEAIANAFSDSDNVKSAYLYNTGPSGPTSSRGGSEYYKQLAQMQASSGKKWKYTTYLNRDGSYSKLSSLLADGVQLLQRPHPIEVADISKFAAGINIKFPELMPDGELKNAKQTNDRPNQTPEMSYTMAGGSGLRYIFSNDPLETINGKTYPFMASHIALQAQESLDYVNRMPENSNLADMEDIDISDNSGFLDTIMEEESTSDGSTDIIIDGVSYTLINDISPKTVEIDDRVVDGSAASQCRHNDTEIDNWKSIRQYLGESTSDNKYTCKYCSSIIGCIHLQYIHEDNPPMGDWTHQYKASLNCKFCNQSVGEADYKKKKAESMGRFSRQVLVVFSSINGLLSGIIPNFKTDEIIPKVQLYSIYHEISRYHKEFAQKQSNRIKSLSIAYGAMLILTFIKETERQTNPDTSEPDMARYIKSSIESLISVSNYTVGANYLSSFVTDSYKRAIALAKEYIIAGGSGVPVKRSQNIADRRKIAALYFELDIIFFRRHGLSIKGINATFGNKLIFNPSDEDGRMSKPGSKLIDLKTLARSRADADLHIQEIGIPVTVNMSKHRTTLNEPATLLADCPKAPKKRDDGSLILVNERKHVWYDVVTKKPYDRCKLCDQSIKELQMKPDAEILRIERNAGIIKTLTYKCLSECPYKYVKQQKKGDETNDIYDDNIAHENVNNKCTLCGYPDAVSDKDFIYKYGFMCYDRLLIDDFIITKDLSTEKEVSLTETKNTSTSQYTHIYDKLPSEHSTGTKLTMLKMFIMSSKFGEFVSRKQLSRINNFNEMSMFLYENSKSGVIVIKDLFVFITNLLKITITQQTIDDEHTILNNASDEAKSDLAELIAIETGLDNEDKNNEFTVTGDDNDSDFDLSDYDESVDE